MQLMTRACALGALVVLAGSAQASFVEYGGNFVGFGTSLLSPPTAVGSASQQSFGATGMDLTSFGGLIRASNTYDSTPGFESQLLELSLTNFTFQSTSNQLRSVSIRIVQDFVLLGSNGTPATASHQVNGLASFTVAPQSFTMMVSSTHESTALPNLAASGRIFGSDPGVIPISVAQGSVTSVAVSPFVYTIDTTFTFTLNSFGFGPASIVLPNGSVNTATIRVPGPSVAALLAMGGLVAARRRRIG